MADIGAIRSSHYEQLFWWFQHVQENQLCEVPSKSCAVVVHLTGATLLFYQQPTTALMKKEPSRSIGKEFSRSFIMGLNSLMSYTLS